MCETDHFNLTQMFKIEMAAGILPWSVDDSGQLVLLLGREADTGHWAGFGGARDRGESLYDTALREGYEESMGDSYASAHTHTRKTKCLCSNVVWVGAFRSFFQWFAH